jgi:adenylylsulfate kinase-like enzyme
VLRARGQSVENLDADEVRLSISPDLKYTEADRDLNTKRLAYIGRLLTRNGTHTIVAAVSSRRSHRDRARAWADRFFECHVKTSVEECRRRDPKGLYARADRGEVNDIAGVHMPYEEPQNPELVIETDGKGVSECVDMVISELEERGWIPRHEVETAGGGVYTRHDEEKIKDRLKKLGYL